MALETFQLRGKNYDDVVRRLVETYNSSQGWAVVRVVNRLTSLDVILERNSEQAKEPEKVSSAKVAKVVEATNATQELAESVSVQVAKDESEEAVDSVKVNVKPVRKAKPQP